MASAAAHYPPSPDPIPRDLTSPSARYRLQVVMVLASLFLFVLLYLALVAGSAFLLYWSVTYSIGRPTKGSVFLKIGLIGISCLLFLFLLKGLFKRHKEDKSLRVEITEEEQPTLFAFIRRLCAETRAPFPYRVYLSPEVNAAVFYNSSFLSLFLPTPKNLLIGLGLVNTLTLSEFKAVLAHEFGHFSQSSMKLGTYVYMSNRIIADMVFGRDWLDELVAKLRGSDIRIAVFAWGFSGVVLLLRKLLELFFKAINFLNLALSRHMEFNADLVAVSVTGSDPLILGLARLDFANDCLMQAFQDLSTAADHQIYTCDMFYHQNHAAEYLRRLRKDPKLGEPPAIPEDPNRTVQVFEPGDTGVPAMWATHPSNYDREQNAKRRYLRGVLDERSRWILFRNAPEVRSKVTRRFYRVVLKVKKDELLAEPETVQAFIDDEHAETTYSAGYHGVYDDRYINPGDLGELAALTQFPGAEGKPLGQLHAQLYGEELKSRMEAYAKHREEFFILSGLEQGQLQLKGKDFEFRGQRYLIRDAKRLLKTVDKDLEADHDRLAALDRKVYWVHAQMARELGGQVLEELEDRYRFHMAAQTILGNLSAQQTQVGKALEYLAGKSEVSQEEFAGLRHHLQAGHAALDESLQEARKLRLPELKNLKAGQALGPFLLEKRLVPSPSAMQDSLDGKWINRFMEQLGEVREKIKRIHFKSLGGILALQEKIAERWTAQAAAGPEARPTDPA